MNLVLLVGFGGVLGAVARYLLGELGDGRGIHTFAVNVLGSAVLGGLLVAPVDGALLLAFGTGFCGAFTTFSTFAVETVSFYDEGEKWTALSSAIANLVGAMVGVALGAAFVGLVSGNL